MTGANITTRVYIAARHPSLAGHFPGNPVVPGVVLLDCIAAALERADAGPLRRIRALKFLAPLLPEQEAQLTIALDGTRVRFQIERAGTPILGGDGELEFARRGEETHAVIMREDEGNQEMSNRTLPSLAERP